MVLVWGSSPYHPTLWFLRMRLQNLFEEVQLSPAPFPSYEILIVCVNYKADKGEGSVGLDGVLVVINLLNITPRIRLRRQGLRQTLRNAPYNFACTHYKKSFFDDLTSFTFATTLLLLLQAPESTSSPRGCTFSTMPNAVLASTISCFGLPATTSWLRSTFLKIRKSGARCCGRSRPR